MFPLQPTRLHCVYLQRNEQKGNKMERGKTFSDLGSLVHPLTINMSRLCFVCELNAVLLDSDWFLSIL